MRHWVSVLFCLLLIGCASPSSMQRPDHLFADHLFSAPSKRIDVAEVFALSDDMKRYLRSEIGAQLRSMGRHAGLAQALTQPNQLKLEYESVMTRTASQAFAARSGNCLSLVIMTAALAKALDLDVQYQSAYSEETWSRSGDLYLRSGHVNITLGRRFTATSGMRDPAALTIDFLPPEDVRGLRTRAIGEETVLAMFMNNRAAEALVNGRLDDAYWLAREAMVQDPNFMSAYNTLGVIYLRQHLFAQAERVLAHALERQPANTRAMANLALVYHAQQRGGDARALLARLASIEPTPPFHYFNLGLAAMRRDDFNSARDFFAREVARADYYHEFHFWLAVANYRLGDMTQAQKHLALAMSASTTKGDQALYAAKLAWLKSRQAHH